MRRMLFWMIIIALALAGCGGGDAGGNNAGGNNAGGNNAGGGDAGGTTQTPVVMETSPLPATGGTQPVEPTQTSAPAALTETLPAVTETPFAATEPVASAATATPAAEATETVPPGMFRNPVYDRDFPDPDVLKVGDTYYAYATNSNNVNIQVAQSQDLVNWSIPPGMERPGEALPRLPRWADQAFGWGWAPEVTTSADGATYLMYFVARFRIGTGGGTQCIGVATAERPEGPFQPDDEEPFICQVSEGGSIDAASFVDDDGKRYILWKNDGNSGGGQSWLYIQPVSDDGLTLLEQPTRLLSADQAWEGVLVEAPTLWKRDGKYYLFYSANAYNTPRYATGYAVADDILGPYTKPGGGLLLQTRIPAGIVGPGGQDIVIGPQGDEWILFHGWAGQAYRRMYLAPLTWEGDRPVVDIKDRGPLPAP